MSTAPPRLSIVVPYYNVEHYIGACLESLARQTFQDFEVILVDDGSKDGSAEVARHYAGNDSRFRVVVQENQGLGPARNTGTRHAQGDYITFVDSDDLVARHAYEIMIRSLDETASSFAGGNARRFNNTAGVRPSWTHLLPYATDQPATHVYDFPALALDRMVWNKVYRRTFWDQGKFEFPAIRYEDYPVTLRAHIDAFTVDVIAAPIYYWRERESGESITQQKFQFGNLRDRVVSAELVLDVLEKRRAVELRQPVHRHLAQIDMTTVAQAFATAPDEELRPLLEIGRRLTGRLDEAAVHGLGGFIRLQYSAMQNGDVELLRRLAEFRASGGLRGGARARRSRTIPWRFENGYPSGEHVPAKAYRLPRKEMSLRPALTRLHWEDDALVLRGTAEIAHHATPATSSLRMLAVSGGKTVALRAKRFPALDQHGEEQLIGWETRVPRSLLARMPEKDTWILLSMRSGLLHRRGALRYPHPGSPQSPAGARIGAHWYQPLQSHGKTVIRRMRDQAELTGAEFGGDHLMLEGVLPDGLKSPRLVVSRSNAGVDYPLTLTPGPDGLRWSAAVPVADLVDEENPEDPFLGRSTRIPHIGHDEADKRMLLLITGFDRAVTSIVAGRVVTLTRTNGLYASLNDGPLRAQADDVRAVSEGGGRILVSGPVWPGIDYTALTWRRFLANSDDSVDAATRVTLDAGRWTAEVDPAGLLPPADSGDSPDWTLFATDGEPYAVQGEPFLAARLPVWLDLGDGRRATVAPRGGTLHLETS